MKVQLLAGKPILDPGQYNPEHMRVGVPRVVQTHLTWGAPALFYLDKKGRVRIASGAPKGVEVIGCTNTSYNRITLPKRVQEIWGAKVGDIILWYLLDGKDLAMSCGMEMER